MRMSAAPRTCGRKTDRHPALIHLVAAALVLTFFAVAAESAAAAKCLGKRAQTIGKRNGSVTVPRNRAALLTGTNVKVFAKGNNRICSTKGNITLRFGGGNANRVRLGSGNDRVFVTNKAKVNDIHLGGGNNTAVIRNKAVSHTIRAGSGNDRITVAFKANRTTVDAGSGNNTVVLAAKANRQSVTTGNGHDRVTVKAAAKANKRAIRTGLGNDTVNVIAKGHTSTWLSAKKNTRGLPDTDTYYGNRSNDTVYDYHGGTADRPNRIHGNSGFDKLHSLGSATSMLDGGDGSDWLYSASSGVAGDRLFGGRGNDKLFADRGSGLKVKGAFLDGNEGDDWFYGTEADDTIVALSGIKKIRANGGDDLIVKTGNGIGTIDGGAGRDTISYIGHTPPGYWKYSGVMVNLQQGKGMNGKGVDTISNVEDLIGSPFDDLLTGQNGVRNRVSGGLGNDIIEAFSGDQVDGGLGINECSGGNQVNCNDRSPGRHDPDKLILDIGEEGIPTIIGSRHGDRISLGYDRLDGAYIVEVNRPVELSRLCSSTQTANRYRCPAPYPVLSTAIVEAGNGDDSVSVANSMPKRVTAIINGGNGHDTVIGGPNKELVSLAEKVNTRGGDDMIYTTRGTVVNAGPGSDAIHIANPCIGGRVSGGKGNKDTAVFAGADRGVHASLKTGVAKWRSGGCANPIRLDRNMDGLEGSKYGDLLEASGRKKNSLLGRDGFDVFKAKNGVRDTVTTAGNGRRNKVVADRKDKVIWGWGLAAH